MDAQVQKNIRFTIQREAPNLIGYLRRIGAEESNFKKFFVSEEPSEGYQRKVATIRISDGKIHCDNDEFSPSDTERKAIEAEIARIILPKSIAARDTYDLRSLLRSKGQGLPQLFEFLSENGEGVQFVQQREEKPGGGKNYWPWSFWSDKTWRCMEPDGLLPLYGLECLRRASYRILIHEGAKAAKFVKDMLADPNVPHPWKEDLRDAAHLGWIGGAYDAQGVNWEPLERAPPHAQLIFVADNDQPGVEAVTEISRRLKFLQRPLWVVRFDDHFPPGFDLADEFPRVNSWWRGDRYIGPRLDDFIKPATWATQTKRVPKSDTKKTHAQGDAADTAEGENTKKTAVRGRPGYVIRKEFAKEWVWVTDPPVFINRSQPSRLLTESAFNRDVRPYSDTDETAKLLIRFQSSHVDGLTYAPGQKSGVITPRGGAKLFNTFQPSDIRPQPGDPKPFSDFLTHLFPVAQERTEMMRWIATLIDRPEIRMHYGVLLISETQGVGKTTLGERILAPLVGINNASVPSEQTISDAKYNSWMAHKRLAVVNELYTGHSRHTYDRLKSAITDTRLEIKRKYVEEYELDIWIHVFACSNSARALHLDDEDRRWFVPRLTEDARTQEYWRDFHSWLSGDGLGIIRQWTKDFLKDNAPVAVGERAPKSVAKMEVIANSRSEGQRLAFDFAESVRDHIGRMWGKIDRREHMERDFRPYVFVVDDVRKWIAEKRRLDLNDQRMESELTVRKALRAAGFHELKRAAEADPRFKIDGRWRYTISTAPLDPLTNWKQVCDVAVHKKPDDVAF